MGLHFVDLSLILRTFSLTQGMLTFRICIALTIVIVLKFLILTQLLPKISYTFPERLSRISRQRIFSRNLFLSFQLCGYAYDNTFFSNPLETRRKLKVLCMFNLWFVSWGNYTLATRSECIRNLSYYSSK